MNSKLKFVSICSLLMIPMIGHAANLACPTAQEIMNAADPATGKVNLQTAFGTSLTGAIVPSVNSYVFAGAAIPLEKVAGQAVYCNYLSTQIHPAPVPLMASTSSVFSPVVGTWETSGSYAACSQNNPSQCQFVQKTVRNTH